MPQEGKQKQTQQSTKTRPLTPTERSRSERLEHFRLARQEALEEARGALPVVAGHTSSSSDSQHTAFESSIENMSQNGDGHDDGNGVVTRAEYNELVDMLREL